MKEKLIKNQAFIVFGEDYARHPHSLEHLLNELLPYNRMLWVETFGLRSPKLSLYDLKRIFGILKKWFGKEKKDPSGNDEKRNHPNLTIISPFMIPFNQFGLVRKFNQWMVQKKCTEAIESLNLKNFLSIASVPQAGDYLKKLKEKGVVYVCVDEFSLWPGINPKLASQMEEKLLAKADLTFATSTELQRTKVGNGPTHLLTHGVHPEHFKLPEKTNKSGPFTLCYFGLFDERSDQDLLIYLANNLPQVEIHIIGDCVVNIENLKAHSNIKFLPKIPFSELPKRLKDKDAFILPYHINKLTKNINPLKLKEYIATGRPVISTALPEVMALNDYLSIGHTKQDFLNMIKKWCKNSSNAEAKNTRHFLENESWKAKAAFFSGHLKQLLNS